jgi:hypothetical protein
MSSKTCREMRRQIDELDQGHEPNAQIAAHLISCPACAAFRNERSALRSLVGSLEPVVAPADFDMRLRARIAATRTAESQPFFVRLIGVPAIAMAAVVVLAVGTTVLISQWNSTPPAGVTAEKQTSAPTGDQGATAPPVKSSQPAPLVASRNDEPPVDKPQSFPGKRNRPPVRGNVGARDYSLIAARSVRPGDGEPFVNAPSQRVEVSLEDDQGTKRKLSLPPVSFGSQSLVNNRVPVSYSSNSRIW